MIALDWFAIIHVCRCRGQTMKKTFFFDTLSNSCQEFRNGLEPRWVWNLRHSIMQRQQHEHRCRRCGRPWKSSVVVCALCFLSAAQGAQAWHRNPFWNVHVRWRAETTELEQGLMHAVFIFLFVSAGSVNFRAAGSLQLSASSITPISIQ